MATNSIKATAKPSFAKIAAMASAADAPKRARGDERSLQEVSPPTLEKPLLTAHPPALTTRELQQSMSHLAVGDSSMPSNPLNDQQKTNISRAGLKFDDEQARVSSSSTKPASLDGKSTTSGTTFALDEKESLRPDDSASVKAAEDEDCGSGPASGALNSRVGSEAGGRAFRAQFYEITENIATSPQELHANRPRTGTSVRDGGSQMSHPQVVNTGSEPIDLLPPQYPVPTLHSFPIQYQEPDEKLLEALGDSKDRLFLLRLEQEVINFVKDSADPMIDLPPCNSFYRLLAHKLADYYALTHWVDNAVSAVRLYRTPYCRLPTPLSALATKDPANIEPIQSIQPAMKIMRRRGGEQAGATASSGANTTDASAAPSKAGSENGDDVDQLTGVASPTESSMAKDKSKISREEREANYKEARERIFGPEGEKADGNDVVNEVSRTSSRNEKKKKKHKNQDDDFETRSLYQAGPPMQYTATAFDQNLLTYYGPYPVQPAYSTDHIGNVTLPNGQQGYQHGYQTMSNGPGFQVTGGSQPVMSYDIPNNGMFTPNQQMIPPCYPPLQQNFGMEHPSPAIPSPALSNGSQFSRSQSQMSDQQWSQNSYAYTHQQARDQQQYFPAQMQAQSQPMGVQTVPYPYGQLPAQGTLGSKSQHPVPGSYKSQAFNPQIRAFVPTGGIPQQMSQQGNGLSNQPPRNPALSYQNDNGFAGYAQPASPYPQAPLMQVPPLHSFSQEPKHYGPRKSSAQSHAAQSQAAQAPAKSSLSKWGTPAHLPPKPPPPEAPTYPEGGHSLPMNNHFNANVQAASSGQPMPNFRNGIYSTPGAGSQL